MPLLEIGRLATLAESVVRSGTRRGSFLQAQEATIHDGGDDDRVLTLPTWSGNGPRRLAGAAASEEPQSAKLARAVPTDWRADA